MTHPTHAQTRTRFDLLLRELEASWPHAALDYVREDLEHAEFGEALENLAALALQQGHPLRAEEWTQLEEVATALGLSDSPHLVRLRSSRSAHQG